MLVSKACGDEDKNAENKVTQNRVSKTLLYFSFVAKTMKSFLCIQKYPQKRQLFSGNLNILLVYNSNRQIYFYIHNYFRVLCTRIPKHSLQTYYKQKKQLVFFVVDFVRKQRIKTNSSILWWFWYSLMTRKFPIQHCATGKILFCQDFI